LSPQVQGAFSAPLYLFASIMSAPTATADPTSQFDYTGFKLGEKKGIKQYESHYTTNLEELRKHLGPEATITIDWPAFQAGIKTQLDREYAGMYLYQRTLSQIVNGTLSQLKSYNLLDDVKPFINSVRLVTCEKERMKFSLEGKTWIIAQDPANLGNMNLPSAFEWIKQNINVPSGPYTGFPLIAANGLRTAEKNHIATDLPVLNKQLPGVTVTIDWASALANTTPRDLEHAGAYFYNSYARDVCNILADMCKSNADYKEALTDAIKGIVITTPKSPSVFSVVLAGGTLTLSLNGERLGTNPTGTQTIKPYLEKTL